MEDYLTTAQVVRIGMELGHDLTKSDVIRAGRYGLIAGATKDCNQKFERWIYPVVAVKNFLSTYIHGGVQKRQFNKTETLATWMKRGY